MFLDKVFSHILSRVDSSNESYNNNLEMRAKMCERRDFFLASTVKSKKLLFLTRSKFKAGKSKYHRVTVDLAHIQNDEQQD